MDIFQHKNVNPGHFKRNNCSKQEQSFLAQSKSIWNKVLWDEAVLHFILFTNEQKCHRDLQVWTIHNGKSAALNTRFRAIFCHFSFLFQHVLKYFLQGAVNYWSIFRIKINLVTKKIYIQDTITRILTSLYFGIKEKG